MYYNDYFRFDDAEEFDCLNDMNELYELETFDLPPYCMYRMNHQIPEYLDDMNRSPRPMSPPGPPPTTVPLKTAPQVKKVPQGKAVDPGSLRPCVHRYVYVWPRNGRPFWAWITFVGRRAASGYRWNGRRWLYFAIDLRRVDSFVCL